MLLVDNCVNVPWLQDANESVLVATADVLTNDSSGDCEEVRNFSSTLTTCNCTVSVVTSLLLSTEETNSRPKPIGAPSFKAGTALCESDVWSPVLDFMVGAAVACDELVMIS